MDSVKWSIGESFHDIHCFLDCFSLIRFKTNTNPPLHISASTLSRSQPPLHVLLLQTVTASLAPFHYVCGCCGSADSWVNTHKVRLIERRRKKKCSSVTCACSHVLLFTSNRGSLSFCKFHPPQPTTYSCCISFFSSNHQINRTDALAIFVVTFGGPLCGNLAVGLLAGCGLCVVGFALDTADRLTVEVGRGCWWGW